MSTSSFLEMRRRNALRILNAIRTVPNVSRADIARRMSLARATVCSIVDELIDLEVVQETGLKKSENGRRPTGLMFNPNARYAVGLSLNNYGVESVLCNFNGERRASTKERYVTGLDLKNLIPFIVDCVRSTLRENKIPISKLGAIGLGVPGPVSGKPSVMIDGLGKEVRIDNYAIRDRLRTALKRSVFIDSNTNMAATAVIHAGAVQNLESAVVIRVGHTVRSALIVDGKLFTSNLGLAGEIGHNQVPGKFKNCDCGKHGCINSVAGYDSVIDACKSISQVSVTNVAQLIALAQSGQTECREVIAEAAKAVGYGISGVINILAPPLVVVYGQLLKAGELFLEPMQSAINDHTIGTNLLNCRVVGAGDFENQPEAFGAALTAIAKDDLLSRT